MLRFVGCDVHKRTAVFTILLEDSRLFATYTVPVTREALTAFAERQLSAGDRLAMEATNNSWAVAGVLRPFAAEMVISNPLRTRAIAEAKIKTDKVDSRVAKGSPRSAQCGHGRTRAVPSLRQVLVQNGLPEIAPLRKGERVMLERARLDGFYRELQQPSRIQANTRRSQLEQCEEDAKSELTQS